ncbi:hypothetical protein D3C84_888440 [compost metagenome]
MSETILLFSKGPKLGLSIDPVDRRQARESDFIRHYGRYVVDLVREPYEGLSTEVGEGMPRLFTGSCFGSVGQLANRCDHAKRVVYQRSDLGKRLENIHY